MSRSRTLRAGWAIALAVLAAGLLYFGNRAPAPRARPTGIPARSPDAPSVVPGGAHDSGTQLGWADGAEATPPNVESAIPRWVREAAGLRDSETADLISNLAPPIDGDRLHPTDLAVLAEIIRINDLDESSSPFDYDDGDGVLEPWELGYQVWRDGRIILLATGPSPNFSFAYAIAALPESIGDLAQIRVLDLHRNTLRELPGSVGALDSLRRLAIGENELSALPDDLAYLALDGLGVGGNRLYCNGWPAAYLTDGTIRAVTGLGAQRC